MPTRPLSDEAAQEAADTLQAHGGNKSHAAAALGLDRGTFRGRLKHAAERGYLGTKPVLPGFAIKSTSTQIGPDGETQREWVRQAKESGEPFQAPDGHAVKGVSALVDAEGRVIQQWIKTREGNEPVDVIEACKAAMEGWTGAAQLTPAPTSSDADLLTLLPCNDWHLGMFAWGAETQTNWDLRIAEDAIGAAVEDVIARSPASVEGIVLGGGDLLHSDNNENRTARSGNALQVDGRYQKVIGVACRLKVRTIDAMLRRHQHVTVRILPGNHDEHAAVAVAYFLAAWYRNEPRVTVDLDPSLFWWFRFGKVMLGATHGHTVKIQRLPGLMAARRAQDWGETQHRYGHGFHVHHAGKMTAEDNGVVLETHRAPIPPDGWHWGAGFLSGRSVQAITYHRLIGDFGRVSTVLMDAMQAEAA